VIGWIPFYESQTGLPGGELKNLWPKGKAVQLLLQSGNRRPDAHFSGPGEFVRDLALKDFRAAAAIDEPKLYLDRSGRVAGFTFYQLGEVGYTPLRGGAVTVYSRGTKRSAWKIEIDEDRVVLNLWIKIKIGWAG
jgi:hypothetical protein